MNSLEFDRYAGGALGLLAYTLSIFRTKGEGGSKSLRTIYGDRHPAQNEKNRESFLKISFRKLLTG